MSSQATRVHGGSLRHRSWVGRQERAPDLGLAENPNFAKGNIHLRIQGSDEF